MTVRERIREYVQGKGEAVSNRELTDALHVHGETVRRTVYRMVASGELQPCGDGGYLLPEAEHVNEHVNSDQDGERDSRETQPNTPREIPDTPAFEGIGKYDHATGGMIPWKPKAG